MGGTYEEWVVAWYLLHLLRGGPVAGLGRLTRVVTQTRGDRWLLDDIRLHLRDGGQQRRVAIGCKAGGFLSAGDEQTASPAANGPERGHSNRSSIGSRGPSPPPSSTTARRRASRCAPRP